jgi:hypothetical protein
MLLSPDQYYRPTRAGELRQQAARLRHRQTGLRTFREVVALVLVGICSFLGLLLVFTAGVAGAFLLVIVALVGAGILAIAAMLYETFLVWPLEYRALVCEREAEALEREHQARYGETCTK